MIIGIDFGNINSFPAYISGIDERTRRGGVDVFLLPPKLARIGIPSTFHFKKARRVGEQGGYTYGKAATLASPGANRRDTLKRRLWKNETIDGEVINYDDVITGMIKHIVDIANDELVKGSYPRCNQISLAYPVIFSRGEKEHLKELAERAVLNDGKKIKVEGMIQEPAAAALEYLSTLPVTSAARDFTVLVYDLGGGTFDAAIVTAHQDANSVMTGYEVLDQIGLPYAGNEFTDAMVNLMIQKFRRIDVHVDTKAGPMERFRREAEELKCTLSEPDTTWVEYEDNDGNVIDITRDELEEATEKLVTETLMVSKQLFDRCPVKPTMVIMTGGQSQMPIIRARLQKLFASIDAENIIFHKPQQAIALGAARFGSLNCGKDKPVLLRTSKMLGLANVVSNDEDRRYVCSLIPRNTQIPMKSPITKLFSPRNPCTKHTICLWEALYDDPDIYNKKHFVEIAQLSIDFNISTPQRLDFEVSVYIDKKNDIIFAAQDPMGKFKKVDITAKYLKGKED